MEFQNVFTYTAEQGVNDGILYNISENHPKEVKEAGFKILLLCTERVFLDLISITPMADKMCNDTAGRVWDVCYMARHAIAKNPNSSNRVDFKMNAIIYSENPTEVELKITIEGYNETGTPCMIISYKNED